MSDPVDDIVDSVDGVTKGAARGLFGILPGILGLSLTMKGIEHMTKEESGSEDKSE
ncbi:MAG: hypothetical protein PHG85_04080 [Candidatus Altiarchaeota archaeon]|nr:hypothetical protein [Candidatus Altiarchaeota archaeon]